MYLLDELVKEHQNTLLNEAESARKFESIGGGESTETGWRTRVGDFLIESGLKLKGQQRQNKRGQISYRVS